MKKSLKKESEMNLNTDTKVKVKENYKKISSPKKKPLQFECTVCDAKFAYKAILYRHISTYHNGKNCKCLECGKTIRNLKLHIQTKHPFKKENVKVGTNVKVENSQDITSEPFEHPDLKKIRQLEEEHKDCEITYRCITCQDFSTPEPSEMIRHHTEEHGPWDSFDVDY